MRAIQVKAFGGPEVVALGADVAIDPNVDDLTSAIRAANDGRRVDVILEMVGGRVFDASLRALARFGRLVTYGLAGREGSAAGFAAAPSKREPRRDWVLAQRSFLSSADAR